MATGDSEGPAWNKFWMSLEHETESIVSGEGGSSRAPQTPDTRSHISPEATRPHLERGDSVMPGESASHHGEESPETSAVAGAISPASDETPFPFKFKAPSGRMHRLQVSLSAGITALVAQVSEKLGEEVHQIGGLPDSDNGKLGKVGFALSYLDNEGDTVSITTDRDLVEAVGLARISIRDKVDLFVHDPEKPPLSATLDPQPVLPKLASGVSSTLKISRQPQDSHTEDTLERVKERRGGQSVAVKEEDQLIPGLANELLLPGAIVALAAVILGVFAISRASRN